MAKTQNHTSSSTANGNAISKGFKKTEVGVIPEDWEVRTLGQVGEVKMCKRIFSYQTSERGEVPFYKIGTFGKEPDAFISWDLYMRFRKKYSFPKKGYLLISASGTIGRTVEYRGEDAYYQDSNIIWIDNDEKIISNKYLNYTLKVIQYNTEGSTIKRLYNSIVKRSKFAIPPTPTEQKAIATALSDVDALISNLDTLITKKKAIKQGAMQELLTPPHKGGKRLPGFSGEWEGKVLGEVANINMGQSPLSKNYNKEGVGLPLIQGNADIKNRKTIIRNYTSQITKTANANDIIMSVRAPVGEIAIAQFDCCIGRGVCSIKYSNDFLYHYLIFIETAWGKFSTGSTFDSINSNQLKELELMIPKTNEEQKAIAQILSDMDTEIEQLQAKKEKYQTLKQGMMQELLTGKTRLV